MRVIEIISFAIAIMLLGCNGTEKSFSEKEQALYRIDSLETIFFDKTVKANPNTGMKLVKEYARFYQNETKDSLAIDMLFKAGEVSMGIHQGNLAVKYFKTVADNHKDFYKTPEALFLTGFCSENLNNDTANARFYYEAFIKTFPEHHLAEDARFSISNMGKTDEELIKMFEKTRSSKADSE